MGIVREKQVGAGYGQSPVVPSPSLPFRCVVHGVSLYRNGNQRKRRWECPVEKAVPVYDLEEAELAYAPPFGSVKGPVNIAGFVASNLLRRDAEYVYAEDWHDAAPEEYTILDVRTPMEHQTGLIPGAKPFPLRELRQFWEDLPRDKPVLLYCREGQRAYYACRFLRQKGVDCRNLAGEIKVYRLVQASVSSA